MHEDGSDALLMGAISHQQQQILGFAFVNNTDLCVMHTSNAAPQVIQQMQWAVTHWEGLLRAMGGALVPEKCFWYLVDFENKNNKWRYKTITQALGEINLLDTAWHQSVIQRLRPSEARQTLGVQLAPDGNMETELTYLLDTAKEWQRKMKTSRLGRLEGNFSLWNVLLRKLVYPLPATTFTSEQCQTIMSPILAQGLPLAGFVCTFPHALAYGPLKMCGINLPNLFTEQMVAHIHMLLKYSNQPQDLRGFL